ncbi:AraC family transcriptional regulator [Pseudovibrio sp. Tun.PSC04-5.I4]|uniref:helix-turn-helix domain-containing protein n=1 Tax=Pseudovibrio sp. Tun.PSC04-5.I4 TaxID=1798213 RepID=UPI00088A87A1|nr:AraC family transcriptional regulator [Pseudovibrio sp. Tun.PSC04-5.I4]SDR47385.1 AraC-type DNA-binding protein [Pseudovibrio sp. Tun.PSC04-5.I4]
MPSLPLPFFTALFLCFILLRLLAGYGRKLPSLLILTIALYSIQSALLGIKWGMGGLPSWALIGLALMLPPVTWLAFLQLTEKLKRSAIYWTTGLTLFLLSLITLAPALEIAVLIDLVGAGVYLGYGFLFFRTATRHQWEWTSKLAISQILPVRRTLLVAGSVFSASALVDLGVAADFALNKGSNAATIVGMANLTMLLALVVLVLVSSRGTTPATQQAVASKRSDTPATSDQTKLLAALDQLMRSEHLYRDEGLSLEKMARRLRVPARQISSAVNSVRGINLPQYTNGFRVEEACHMLETTDTPITTIIFEVGFTTKSNFNREFQRITEKSPSAWRKAHKATKQAEPA